MAEPDFLEKMIDKRTARNPEFPKLLDAARRRRELLRALADQREAQRRSQTALAAAMNTSQSFVARLESTAPDAKISTVDRYAESLGFVVQYHLVPLSEAESVPTVVVHQPSLEMPAKVEEREGFPVIVTAEPMEPLSVESTRAAIERVRR
jgi:transcriptional regulator with XRE-family HTH domain